MSVESFNLLIQKLSQSNSNEIEQELKKFKYSEIIPQLEDIVLFSKDESSRLLAIKSLRWIADPSPLLKLKDILEVPDPHLSTGEEIYQWRLGLIGMWTAKYKSLSRITFEDD